MKAKLEIIKKIRNCFDITTIKFLIVGGINTLVGTGVMFILYNIFAVNYWISSMMNYIVGSIVSYFLNKIFTFRNREKSMKQVISFIINILTCYIIAYGAAKPTVSFILSGMDEKLQDNAAMFVGMCIFVVLNYFGQRFFVFKNRQDH